jgi:hypothetical protein
MSKIGMATVSVKLHVYDIANTDNENLNTILKIVNNVSREVRAGGIYHGALVLTTFFAVAPRSYTCRFLGTCAINAISMLPVALNQGL